jgi:hypothetical protein
MVSKRARVMVLGAVLVLLTSGRARADVIDFFATHTSSTHTRPAPADAPPGSGPGNESAIPEPTHRRAAAVTMVPFRPIRCGC